MQSLWCRLRPTKSSSQHCFWSIPNTWNHALWFRLGIVSFPPSNISAFLICIFPSSLQVNCGDCNHQLEWNIFWGVTLEPFLLACMHAQSTLYLSMMDKCSINNIDWHYLRTSADYAMLLIHIFKIQSTYTQHIIFKV